MKNNPELLDDYISSPITVVDVGSDGGVHEIEGLAPYCSVHAFEPRQKSYEALVNGNKSLVVYDGKNYGNISYYKYALAKSEGIYDLYVTKIPQASSLLEPDLDVARSVRGEDDETLVVEGREKVNAITLNKFVEITGLDWVDYIKLDTQGTELDILKGAGDFIKKISVIRMEVEFVKLYKNQPLFDDCVSYLNDKGFRFLDLQEIATTNNDRKGKKVWGEAFFINTDVCPTEECAIKKALVLIELGYNHEARWMLSRSNIDIQRYKNFMELTIEIFYGRKSKHMYSLIKSYQKFNSKRKENGKRPFNLSWIRKIIGMLPFGRSILEAVQGRSLDKMR